MIAGTFVELATEVPAIDAAQPSNSIDQSDSGRVKGLLASTPLSSAVVPDETSAGVFDTLAVAHVTVPWKALESGTTQCKIPPFPVSSSDVNVGGFRSIPNEKLL